MARELTISMFNVGFGDCFLVEIPCAVQPCRILFDCGRHTGGDDANQALADAVIAAATSPGAGARIDLVVATHRHKDHVSGFRARGWDGVQVREVWMPWTEDPTDPRARGVVERQATAAAAAAVALERAALDEAGRVMAGVVELGLTNEAAMETLYHGFAGSPARRYLPAEEAPLTPLTLPGFPEICFHVMGPPRAEATMGIMDPPRAETFKRLAAAASSAAGGPLLPFETRWHADATAGRLLTAEERRRIGALSDTASLAGLAAAIDSAINNTSLVIMVEVGAAHLLFCADAQWGNWQTILSQPHWRDLLRQTSFLKVGHHASHNASPVTLIEQLLPAGIPAMVSTDPQAYDNVPYGRLLDALGTRRFNVARSDEAACAAPYTRDGDVIRLSLTF